MHREDQFIPQLIVRGGTAALEFYKKAFGAEEVDRMMTPDGTKLTHGELLLDGHKFFVSDEFSASEGGSCKSPHTLGGTGVRITIQVDDAKQTVDRAAAAGARITRPVEEMFWGARYAIVEDPDGNSIGLMSPVDKARKFWPPRTPPSLDG